MTNLTEEFAGEVPSRPAALEFDDAVFVRNKLEGMAIAIEQFKLVDLTAILQKAGIPPEQKEVSLQSFQEMVEKPFAAIDAYIKTAIASQLEGNTKNDQGVDGLLRLVDSLMASMRPYFGTNREDKTIRSYSPPRHVGKVKGLANLKLLQASLYKKHNDFCKFLVPIEMRIIASRRRSVGVRLEC